MADLTDIEMDALREIGNVGMGNAATALSKMISKKVDINLPSTEFVGITNFPEVAGGRETVVDCLFVPLTGDISGNALFFFSHDSALRLIDIMMGKEPGSTKELSEMDMSSFTEMANIVAGAYLSSMANMLKISIFPSPPKSASDMLQAVIDAILAELAKHANEVLFIKTNMTIDDVKIEGTFTLLFDEDSLNIVLKKLKEQFEI